MISLEEIKAYLRVDGNEEDLILNLLLEAAKEYLRQAGVEESDNPLYKTAVIYHVTMHYENRNPENKLEGYEQVFNHIIPKLKEGF